MTTSSNPRHLAFAHARQFLLDHRAHHSAAVAGFEWPQLTHFNWALDWFDVHAQGNNRLALWVVDDAAQATSTPTPAGSIGSSSGLTGAVSFAQMSERSNRVANHLRSLGVKRGDRVLLMLPNVVPLWEVTLAAIKLGAVVSPATTLLATSDLQDRITRGGMQHVVVDSHATHLFEGVQGSFTRVVVGNETPSDTPKDTPKGKAKDTASSWLPYSACANASPHFEPDGPTAAADPLLLYFTSGTTALPKMVLHTHQSYPVGHLSTMYWLGLRPGDVHWNISSPGWGKHAWSSFYAPWNAGATVFVLNQARFDAKRALDAIVRCAVTSLCAPPTVWRSFILLDLAAWPVKLTEVLGAGEPLNPEVIHRVQTAWGLTLRDGYGQTESTCMVGNPPGMPVREGSMGQAMPGYPMVLLGPDDRELPTATPGPDYTGPEGELSVRLQPAPTGLMQGYEGLAERNQELLGGSHYRTSDVARRDADGYFWYVGRADDVFKASDYRISPFELESALLEHPAVAEAAVVPSPDALRLAVPKAFVVLKPGMTANADVALTIFTHLRQRLAPFKRVRRLQFAELPKTVSGKIRRVQLREAEAALRLTGDTSLRAPGEFWEEDFAQLK
jgi:acetyl-CoA synthetase